MVFVLRKEIKKKYGSRRGKSPKTAFLLILSILAVVLVSGCIANFPGVQRAGITNPTVVSETQDLVLKAEAVPLEVRSGKRLEMFFEIDALKDLKEVSFNITDACLFSGDYAGVFEKQDMKENKSRDFKASLTAGGVDFITDCRIRFKTNYSASLVAVQDIIVLSESEFLTEQRTGKISERTAQFASTSNPLQISISFSSPQPFEDKTDEFMYIEYFNAGSGNLEKLGKDSVQFSAPGNVKMSCDDYRSEGGKNILNRDLFFTNNRAKKSTCKLTTQAQEPVDSKTLQLTANYLYAIDNFIDVKIRQK